MSVNGIERGGVLVFHNVPHITAAAEATVGDVVNKADRNAEIHRLRDVGMTQQAIADEVGISQKTVSNILSDKSVITEKLLKREILRYTVSSYTKPETAAAKIRDKFGDEFATLLKEAL